MKEWLVGFVSGKSNGLAGLVVEYVAERVAWVACLVGRRPTAG